MKKVLLFGILCFMILGIKVCADDSYLVWLDDSIQLFSVENQAQGDGFITMGEADLAECLDAGIVERYIPNIPVKLCDLDWNQQAINVDFPQSIGCRGNDVTVAVIDSGVQEIGVLQGRVLPGMNLLSGTTDVTDTVGHGTFVSGIIAAGADKCKIIPLKCFDADTTDLGYILNAIYHAVVTYEVDVINMSVSFSENAEGVTDEQMAQIIDVFNQYVTNASDAGVLVVCAVGNDSTAAMHYPAGCLDAVGVGAVDAENAHCSFSQYNDSVFVVAPGRAVVSTAINGYTSDSGTSFAAPHVSALAAIAKSMNPKITTAEFKTLLMDTSIDLGVEGRDDYYGYGLIDCEAAAKKLMAGEQVYISPIDKTASGTSAVFYNNTSDSVTAWCIFASYGQNGLSSAPVMTMQTILPGKTYSFENSGTNDSVSFMAWKNLETLQPLGSSRQ
ncbi:MAG: hypothetical protein E7400_05480 [Ruminococcaceae bacterium]|nr:hypothetical protein [Oscillospiraceae bacterium]